MGTPTTDHTDQVYETDAPPQNGFFKPDNATKLVVSTLVVTAVAVWIPVLFSPDLKILDVTWLFWSMAATQAILLLIALIGMYVLVGD